MERKLRLKVQVAVVALLVVLEMFSLTTVVGVSEENLNLIMLVLVKH